MLLKYKKLWKEIKDFTEKKKTKVGPLNIEEIPLEKSLLINNAVMHVESIYYDDNYNYHQKVFSVKCTLKYKKMNNYYCAE